MNKYSTYLWFGGQVSLDIRLKAIKDAGFDSVAILYSDEYKDYLGNKKEIVKKIIDSGLNIENFHTPYLHAFDLFSDDELKREAIYNLYIECIDDASYFNVDTLVIHLTNDNTTYPINMDGMELVNKLNKYAKSKNINLAYENLRGDALDYLYYVLDNFKDDNVGLCYDYGHAHVFSNDEFELLRKYGNRLKVLHLHGNNADWDYHKRLRDGNGDLFKLKEILDSLHFTCPYGLEVIQKIEANDYKSLLAYLKTMKEDLCILTGEKYEG